MRKYITNISHCSTTNKWVYSFTVCGHAEEAIATDRLKAKLIAYTRIAQLISTSPKVIAPVSIHPAALNLPSHEFRKLLVLTGNLRPGCSAQTIN